MIVTDLDDWFMTEATATKRRRNDPEKQVQSEIVKALRDLGFFVATTSQAQRAQMTAGIPDVWCAHRKYGQHWIEVKEPKRRNHRRGGLTFEQVAFHQTAKACGVSVFVAYGLDDVLAELKRLGVPIT